MTTGFSPFLIADVDETFGFSPRCAPVNDSRRSTESSARLELIRRRVVTGYYASPSIATEVARRLLELDSLENADHG